MAVPIEDWIKDTSWSESHLTRGGWKRGTQRSEKGRYEAEVDPPDDRLLTIRSFQKIPSNPAEKPRDWAEIKWVSKDLAAVERAQFDWGVLPYGAPLSRESASKFPKVPNLMMMQKPVDDRPPGRRARRW